MFEIVIRTIRDRKVSLLVYCVGIVLFVWMYVGLFPSIQEQSESFKSVFENYPSSVFDALGIDQIGFDNLEQFLSLENYSFIWPIMAMLLLIGYAGSAIAGQVERGTIGLLLAQPISRLRAYAEYYIAGLLMLIFFSVVSVFSVVPFSKFYSVSYDLSRHGMVFLLVLLFGWSILSIGFLFSSLASEKGRALMLSGGTLMIMYVLNVVARLLDRVDWLQYFSLFHYFDHSQALVDGRIEPLSILVFIGVAITTTSLGAWYFVRRNIAV